MKSNIEKIIKAANHFAAKAKAFQLAAPGYYLFAYAAIAAE